MRWWVSILAGQIVTKEKKNLDPSQGPATTKDLHAFLELINIPVFVLP